jgi:large subunit ribosomal protein L4
MANQNVVKTDNSAAGEVELSPVVFEAQVKPDLLHAEVRRQLALRHAGTHSTKNRHGVSGGGAKPWRQKGTGRARQGTSRAPQWAGGGVAFGPVPRSYDHAIPKKVRAAALRSAISLRRNEGALVVLDSLELDDFKTSRVAQIVDALGVQKGALFVIAEADEKLERSARNIPKVDVIRAEGLNVYDVLRHANLVLTRAAVDLVTERLSKVGKRVRGAATAEATS